MSARTTLDLELASDPKELPRAREHIRAWLGENGWSEEQLADVVLAVDEALTNVIRHGYEGQPGNPVELSACTFIDPDHGAGIQIALSRLRKAVPLQSICSRDLDDLRPAGSGCTSFDR